MVRAFVPVSLSALSRMRLDATEWFWLVLAVRDRDRDRCQRCFKPNDGRMDVHHVLPRSRGGKHELDNLKLMCPDCHTYAHNNRTEAYEMGWIRQ